MQIEMTDWSEADTCLWCSKEKECVTVTFDGGFLSAATLCWHCLQNAVRVRSRQPVAEGGTDTTGNRQTRGSRPAED